MSAVRLPPPTTRPTGERVDVERLEAELSQQIDGAVRFDATARAAYSTDASNYRQVPIGVVVPRTIDAAVAAVDICRRHRAPLLSRGRHQPRR